MSAVAHGKWEQSRTTGSPSAFRPFCPGGWEGKRAPGYDWLVDGCFLKGTVAMLSGDGGLGKSLLMQQLCTAAATGQEWLGLATQRCRTFALFCEDDVGELHRRQEKINKHYGVAGGELEDVLYASRAGEDSVLMRFPKWGQDGETTALYTQLTHSCRDLGAQLIVVDTLADTFAGNEVDRNQPRTFVRALRRLAIELQACVILTQHPSMMGMQSGTGSSGSTGWNNSVRSRLYLTSPKPNRDGDIEDRNVRWLKTMKANHGQTGGKLKLRWLDGVFVRDDIKPPTVDWTSPQMDMEWRE
jgi:RecA-family ATPase